MPNDSAELTLSASHSGRTEGFSLPYSSATVEHLQTRLRELFDVDPLAQKILLPKGRKLPLDSPTTTLLHPLLPSPSPSSTVKLLLIGPASASLSALLSAQSDRAAKHSAFVHHATHRHAPVRNTTSAAENAERERWRFREIRPFPPSVPCEEKRKAMLMRLSEDRAVRDVMERHK